MRVVVAAVLRRLTDAGRYTGILQAEHRLIRVLRFRPPTDQGIEGILMRDSGGEIFETSVLRPLRMSREFGQRAPFSIREAGDGEPAVFSDTGIDAMRRGRLVRGAVAVA